MHRVAVLRAALALAAFAAVPAAARAETPDAFAARVAALDDAARPKSEVVTYRLVANGLAGSARVVRRGDDVAETDTLGPFVTARGSLASRSWHQNENGITVAERPDASPTPGPKRVSLARVSHPRDLWLLRSELANGATQTTAYDPRDLTVVREEVARGTHVARLDYDDFRPWNGGRRRAWHVAGGDDRGNRYERTITSDDVAANVDDAALAIPPDRRTLVTFPDGTNQATLPARVDAGRIHVRLEIGGTPLWFVLDSGASGIVLDAGAAKDLKLPSYGAASLTVAGTFTSSKVVAPIVTVGPLVMRDVVMSTAPFDEREGRERVVGLLGFDFIAGAVLRIDYIDPGGVTAIRPSIFTPPLLAKSAMPIDLTQQVPLVTVGVGTTTSDRMIVDTGAETPVLFFDRFVRAHPDAVVDRGSNAPFDPAQNVVYGVGGRVAIVPLRIGSFRFADLDFKNYVVLRAQDPGAFGDFRDDGLLGALFLRFYTVYVDYPHAKLYFEPNENYTRGVGKPVIVNP